MKHFKIRAVTLAVVSSLMLVAAGCDGTNPGMSTNPPADNSSGGGTGFTNEGGTRGGQGDAPILLVIDEDCIDNGNQPNNFSELDVNDQKADLGQRDQLRYFRNNVGRTINLYSGEVGDEGLFALRTIPSSWISAGPTNNGARNFVVAGPGLGSPNVDDDREAHLDKIPNVTPLRARGLTMLTDQVIFAVVFDGDLGMNYSPLNGSLKGATLGIVALRVIDVVKRTDGSSGSLPRLRVEILDANAVGQADFSLFTNAPVPPSSGEPFDVNPPSTFAAPILELAD